MIDGICRAGIQLQMSGEPFACTGKLLKISVARPPSNEPAKDVFSNVH